MARYIITINTAAYKPMQANMKCWERGTINDFMEALNGYKVTERSLKAVKRRINLFDGHGHSDAEDINEYFNWLNNPKNKARITFYDKLCEMERTEDVAPYGFKQGYFDIEKVLDVLKSKGVVTIPFEWVYDIRQSLSKRFKGCYMQIVKV